MLGCLAEISGQSVIVIGTEKGNSMESRIKHNFGMAKPQGYRKAQRLMNIADKYNLPIITFVDTAGAFPGKDAEERGQSESIASSIQTSLKIGSPIISIVIGEGGSGGAIALATADKVLMLEHSIYSVISPEGCASILWRSSDYIQKAAESLKLTAQDCLKNKIIDMIVKEVAGGAHRFPEEQADIIKNEIKLLKEKKEKAQPTKIKTSGSTFKNPIEQSDKKVWQLIKDSVSLDKSFGDACISEKHCNFFVNKGNAKFEDMKKLIEFVSESVFKKTGIKLETEIKILE